MCQCHQNGCIHWWWWLAETYYKGVLCGQDVRTYFVCRCVRVCLCLCVRVIVCAPCKHLGMCTVVDYECCSTYKDLNVHTKKHGLKHTQTERESHTRMYTHSAPMKTRRNWRSSQHFEIGAVSHIHCLLQTDRQTHTHTHTHTQSHTRTHRHTLTHLDTNIYTHHVHTKHP